MESYCKSSFWNYNMSWNTPEPDFTACFEQTVLLWPVCAFLWIYTIYQICFSRKSSSSSSFGFHGMPSWTPGWTWLTYFKLINLTLLIIAQLVFLYFNFTMENSNTNFDPGIPPVQYITPIVIILTHLSSALIILIHKSRCVHTSGVHLTHWTLLSIVNGLLFRTHFRTDQLLTLVTVQGIIFALTLFQTFLFCWSDIPYSNYTPIDSSSEKAECPLLRCSVLSHILFSWCTPLLRQGAKLPLTTANLWNLIPSLKSSHVFPIFSRHFDEPCKSEKPRSIFQNLFVPLWKTCGMDFLFGIVCKLAGTLLMFLAPTMMGLLIDFVEDKEIEQWKGYLYACILFLIYVATTVLWEQFHLYVYKCDMNIYTSLNLMIYRKSMIISSQARKQTTSGEIVNLMSVDVHHICGVLWDADVLWSSPLFILLGIYLLWNELGYAFLPGIVILVTIIPINWYLTYQQSSYQRDQMTEKDNRIQAISEVLGAIQTVKLYAWEPSFIQQVNKIRQQEVTLLKKRAFCQSGSIFLLDSVPFLVSAASFFTFVYVMDGVLDAKKAFTALALFNLLTDPITQLPAGISELVDAMVSVKRVNDFFNAEEIQSDATTSLTQSSFENDPAVEIVNGTFAWEETINLLNLNIKVNQGSLTAIVGSVGSGKSSLLSAILGDMKKLSGQVTVRGSVAFVPQTAWILNDTVRENILFGQKYQEEKYKKVVECCCLGPDIEMLPAGDLTEIGEKGVNLSGGQKQRISIARAAYSEAEVMLFDDVLSAVDSHVAKNIWNKLLGPKGLLKGKTIVLCTHAYQFLGQVDQIVMLEQGKIRGVGTYEELMRKESDIFANVAALQISAHEDDTSKCVAKEDQSCSKLSQESNEGHLIEEETVETGHVKYSVFLKYVKAMGYTLTVSFILLFAISEGLSLARNIVLSQWTANTGNSTTSYALKYSVLGLCQCVCFLLAYILVAIAGLRAAQILHNNLFLRIIHATMRFFHVTPLGRLTNRFSSDMESLDEELSSQLADWISHVFMLVAVFAAIIFSSNWYFLLCIVPLTLIYGILQRYTILSMQQLKRLLSQSESPIYSMFQESLTGTSSLRAFRAQDRFMEMLGNTIDKHNEVDFVRLVVFRWLTIRLGVLGAAVVFISALFAVIWRDTMEPGLVGLSISYAVRLTTILDWLVKVTSYIQYGFVSVERILEYCGVEQEADFQNGSRECPKSWPEKGEITFEEYGTRYRPGLELVLKEFTCKIESGEKIGIVGRTGAGKSSLTLALFRILEATQGRIWIDGVNIAELGLHRLRKSITVIPQDPTLFSGSLRLNLDPFEEYEDDRLWEVLSLAHLKEFVDGTGEGLEFEVAEGGENLSVGQKNLVCLARAILRKSRILILDEATASVDRKTDELIQKTIREQFKGCTILNVAHRLNTVLDSTRILVLDSGKIAEFDTPENLLSDQKSLFYGMARDAGIS